MSSMKSEAPAASNSLNLILSWAFVGIPLAWGVWNTIKNAIKLFS